MFPMMMTAAGTVAPARVFVIGAGVAGLQAIASSRRLGAKVEAYDVRPAVKEQVESLGAKFVELPLETSGAEDKGGYAKAQDEAFYQRQRELMARAVAGSDVVITTAVVPGKKAPVLIRRCHQGRKHQGRRHRSRDPRGWVDSNPGGAKARERARRQGAEQGCEPG
jgi:NAD(P) transhydrogenase subunit alpha